MIHLPQSNDPEKLYAEGEEAERLGRYDEAEKLYLEFAQLLPDDPRGPNKLGVCQAKRRQFDSAEQLFRRSLLLNAKYPPALTNLGNIMLERNNPEGAVTYYEEALLYDPEYSAAHNNLAAALKRMGKLHPAVQHLKQAQRNLRREDRQKVRKEMRGCSSRGTTAILLVAVGALSAGVFWH